MTVAEHGGTEYSSTSACGQLHQSYQDYTCSAAEDEMSRMTSKAATGVERGMACEVDPNMEMRAMTHAKWYGAPAPLFCAPKSKVPMAPKWNHGGAWCPPEGQYGHDEIGTVFTPGVFTDEFATYVNEQAKRPTNDHTTACREFEGQQAGNWELCGPNKDQPCEGSEILES